MREILIVLVALFFVQACIAQKVLVLFSPVQGETQVLKPGTELVYRIVWEDTLRYGVLQEVKDSSFVVGDLEIFISDLAMIGGNTKTQQLIIDAFNFLGKALFVAGQAMTETGFSIILDGDRYFFVVGGGMSALGLFMWGAGYLVNVALTPVLLSLKPFPMQDGWQVYVANKAQLIYDDDVYDNALKKKQKKK